MNPFASKKIKRYKVKVRFEFEGTFEVLAEDKLKAYELIGYHCGIVLGKVHSTSPDIIDWDVNLHPDKVIDKIKKM